MRRLLIAAAAALLASCAAAPEPQLQAQGRGRVVIGAATLASIGTFEWTAAPAYTRLALLRQRAASRLDAKRITVDQARQVQAIADKARGRLDDAMSAHTRNPEVAARELAGAQSLIEQGEAILKEAAR